MMMRKRTAITPLMIFALISLLFLSCSPSVKYELVVYNQETKEEYLRIPVQLGERLQLSWTHSVELSSWIETIEIQDGQFKIIESRFKNYGAGVSPTTEGKIRIEDGFVILYDLNQIEESYRWIHSQKQGFTLAKEGEEILLAHEIPHHQKVEMIIEKR